MVMKQKQAFIRMQSQCDTLRRQQAKMQSKMDVMEYETRCLRVGAIHPQVIVDQLDEHATELEDENEALCGKQRELESHTQLFVRMTTRNFEEAVRARKENRPPEFKD